MDKQSFKRLDVVEANRKRIWKQESKEKLRKYHLGIKLSDKTKMKISQATKGTRLNDDNPAWKGDRVSIGALHDWVKYRLEKPIFCQSCHMVSPFDLANISQEYKRDLSDWEWLCRGCHMLKDGRLERLNRRLYDMPRL